MNSYPLELLAQLAPVMFVAGLNPAPPPGPSSSSTLNVPPQPPPPTHHSRHASVSDPKLDSTSGSGLGIGTGAPSNTAASVSTTSTQPTRDRPDPFTILTTRLREMLVNQRKVTVWEAGKEKEKIFQVVLVDKEVRFPPRKTGDVGHTAHSPLSPLTPTSPLHPDGLIAPLWIRKHTMLVPSVFVLFTRLFEGDSSDSSSVSDADTHLASQIALRKKQTNEWGVKLTVVLLASRKMLDDPQMELDARLTFIRRQSGLDSRAALFVLSPIARDELSEFVKSLQAALWDPAVEYYTAHSKRVRQKRNRLNTSSSNANANSQLSPTGWTLRYEYKMACFAEFRGENEVALKHYQDAYAALMKYFLASASAATTTITSTTSTPTGTGLAGATSTSSGLSSSLIPRTKRWAEARVLADTISIKITKLYFYNNETALGMAQHRLHVGTFPTVAGLTAPSSASAGKTGTRTGYGYEYWSWVGRMWSVLGELAVEGTSHGLVIPIHRPRLPTTGTSAGAAPRGQGQPIPAMQAMGITVGGGVGSIGAMGGLNPTHALMHPGWYYLLAAECAERKVGRFVETAGGMTMEQRTANVRAMVGDVLELYTKSYELFKAYASSTSTSSSLTSTSTSNPPTLQSTLTYSTSGSGATTTTGNGGGNGGAGAASNRLPLYIAHRIALTYAQFPDPTTTTTTEGGDSDSTTHTMTEDSNLEFDQFEQEWMNSDSETLEFKNKDPEKLLLAAKFLERIVSANTGTGAGGWWSTWSLSSHNSAFDNDNNNNDNVDGERERDGDGDGLDWERWQWQEDQGGWPLLLIPLLRTWSRILKALIGGEVRNYRSKRTPEGEKELDSPRLRLRAHVESYTRVLVLRLGVDRDPRDSVRGKGKGQLHLQDELNRAIRLWTRVSVTESESVSVLRINPAQTSQAQDGPHTEATPPQPQPIFDTSAVFWSARIWVGEGEEGGFGGGGPGAGATSETGFTGMGTPFQLTLTAPTRVKIDSLDWGEVRAGVEFEFEGWEGREGEATMQEEQEQEEGIDGDEFDEDQDKKVEVDVEEEGQDSGPSSEGTATDENNQGQGHGQGQGGRVKMKKKREWEIIIRHVHSSLTQTGEESESEEDEYAVRTIDVGYLDFGAAFTKTSGKASRASKLIQLSTPLRWRIGQTVLIRGLVGVSGGGGDVIGVGEGRIKISSLVLGLHPFPSSSPTPPGAVIEIPLSVPAKRGAIPPLPSSSSLLGVDAMTRSAGMGLGARARWFVGFVEDDDDTNTSAMGKGKGKRRVPKWVPVPASASGSASDRGFGGRGESASGSGRSGYDYVDIQRRPHPVTVLVRHSGPAYVGEEYPVEVVVRGCECRTENQNHGDDQEEEEEEVDVIMDLLLQPVETDITAVNTISIGSHQSNTMIRGIPLGSLVLHPRFSSTRSTSGRNSEITQTLLITNTGGAGERVVDMSVRTRPKMRGKVKVDTETETLKTISIPCVDPLKVSYDVVYQRRAASDSGGGSPPPWDAPAYSDSDSTLEQEAVVRTTIGCVGPWAVEVEMVVLRRKVDPGNARILSSEMSLVDGGVMSELPEADDDESMGMGLFPLEFLPEDELADVCRIGIANQDDVEDGGKDVEIPGPGDYEISWRKILPNNLRGPLSTTHFSLPSLQPPMDEIIALLDVAPVGKLHEPFPLTLTIRNRHPTRTAEVYVQLETASASSAVESTGQDPSASASTSGTAQTQVGTGFVVAGIRAGRVPLLLAGAEERLVWMLIPVECGYVQLPKIRVVDRRRATRGTAKALGGGGVAGADDEREREVEVDAEGGREVRVVDVRVEQRRRGKGAGESAVRVEAEESEERIAPVLVLP